MCSGGDGFDAWENHKDPTGEYRAKGELFWCIFFTVVPSLILLLLFFLSRH